MLPGVQSTAEILTDSVEPDFDPTIAGRAAVGGGVADPTKVRARPIHRRMDGRSAADNIVRDRMPRGVWSVAFYALFTWDSLHHWPLELACHP
jgi:hypothetical protein